MVDWWAGAAGALLGAIIGGCIPLGWSARLRQLERHGELVAMIVEMYHAHLAMDALRTERIAAPLYRLPLTMFGRALPKLIGEGLLTENEVGALIEYVMRSEELNRGLDRAGDAATARPDQVSYEEFDRNVAKVAHILDDRLARLNGETVFDAANSALIRVNRRRWWQRARRP